MAACVNLEPGNVDDVLTECVSILCCVAELLESRALYQQDVVLSPRGSRGLALLLESINRALEEAIRRLDEPAVDSGDVQF